jgi:hypothetical protein
MQDDNFCQIEEDQHTAPQPELLLHAKRGLCRLFNHQMAVEQAFVVYNSLFRRD